MAAPRETPSDHQLPATLVELAGQRLRNAIHRAFHAAVVGLAENRQLNIALAPILIKLQLPMAVNLREEARHQHSSDGIERHQAILAALQTNDPALVVAAMHEHGHLAYLRL